jgi:hypothetical protein
VFYNNSNYLTPPKGDPYSSANRVSARCRGFSWSANGSFWFLWWQVVEQSSQRGGYRDAKNYRVAVLAAVHL